jgi:hypothetical protein
LQRPEFRRDALGIEVRGHGGDLGHLVRMTQTQQQGLDGAIAQAGAKTGPVCR